VIETFRDNNFHTLDVLSELEMSKVEQCIQNMYIQLNKRLALNQQINVETQTQLLLAWLFCLYDKSRLARIKLFSLKVVLTTLCSGKLVDKLKYTFNQISEHNKNLLSMHKFDLYLRELLVLPKAVFEEPSFGYNDTMARSCFDAVRISIFLFLFYTLALDVFWYFGSRYI
jgi:predicted transcriptional regulator